MGRMCHPAEFVGDRGTILKDISSDMNYREFLESKMVIAPESGFEIGPSQVNPALKPHQRDAVVWAATAVRTSPRKTSEETRARIIEMYAQGMSQVRIARELHCSTSTTSKILAEAFAAGGV